LAESSTSLASAGLLWAGSLSPFWSSAEAARHPRQRASMTNPMQVIRIARFLLWRDQWIYPRPTKVRGLDALVKKLPWKEMRSVMFILRTSIGAAIPFAPASQQFDSFDCNLP